MYSRYIVQLNSRTDFIDCVFEILKTHRLLTQGGWVQTKLCKFYIKGTESSFACQTWINIYKGFVAKQRGSMFLCRLYQATEPCFELVKRFDQRMIANASEGEHFWYQSRKNSRTYLLWSLLRPLKDCSILHTCSRLQLDRNLRSDKVKFCITSAISKVTSSQSIIKREMQRNFKVGSSSVNFPVDVHYDFNRGLWLDGSRPNTISWRRTPKDFYFRFENLFLLLFTTRPK